VNLGGYADRIARVDLTAGTIAYEGINEDDARKYIGGRGLGLKYLFDHGPLVEPLGPDNMLGFFGGPLTGSLAKQSGRSCLTSMPFSRMARSPSPMPPTSGAKGYTRRSRC
jgi:aldehyde:ferredoxin oxidoreductase